MGRALASSRRRPRPGTGATRASSSSRRPDLVSEELYIAADSMGTSTKSTIFRVLCSWPRVVPDGLGCVEHARAEPDDEEELELGELHLACVKPI